MVRVAYSIGSCLLHWQNTYDDFTAEVLENVAMIEE
jgi:hypothetical protein